MSSETADSEKAECCDEYLEGFAEFAEFIGSEDELSLYKGFSALAARNLLYLQAELLFTARKLAVMDAKDKNIIRNGNKKGKADTDAAARAWEGIVCQIEANDQGGRERMELILKVRKLMRVYGLLESALKIQNNAKKHREGLTASESTPLVAST